MRFLDRDLWRARWGVVIPAPNTAVEPDLWSLRPPGITFHIGRVPAEAPPPKDEAEYARLEDRYSSQIQTPEGRAKYEAAFKLLSGIGADHFLFPVSLVTTRTGIEGLQDLQRLFEQWSGGVGVTLGGQAVVDALEALGVRRVAVVSPYSEPAQQHVLDFLTEAGYDVVRSRALALGVGGIENMTTAMSVAEVVETLVDVDGPDVDVIFQSGANMSILAAVEEAERRTGKPVLGMNPTTVWSALRSNGFADRLEGCGVLFRQQ